jgi:hypothetical protein
MHRFVL